MLQAVIAGVVAFVVCVVMVTWRLRAEDEAQAQADVWKPGDEWEMLPGMGLVRRSEIKRELEDE